MAGFCNTHLGCGKQDFQSRKWVQVSLSRKNLDWSCNHPKEPNFIPHYLLKSSYSTDVCVNLKTNKTKQKLKKKKNCCWAHSLQKKDCILVLQTEITFILVFLGNKAYVITVLVLWATFPNNFWAYEQTAVWFASHFLFTPATGSAHMKARAGQSSQCLLPAGISQGGQTQALVWTNSRDFQVWKLVRCWTTLILWLTQHSGVKMWIGERGLNILHLENSLKWHAKQILLCSAEFPRKCLLLSLYHSLSPMQCPFSIAHQAQSDSWAAVLSQTRAFSSLFCRNG